MAHGQFFIKTEYMIMCDIFNMVQCGMCAVKRVGSNIAIVFCKRMNVFLF